MARAEDEYDKGQHKGTNGTQRPLAKDYPAPRPSTGATGSRRPSTLHLGGRA